MHDSKKLGLIEDPNAASLAAALAPWGACRRHCRPMVARVREGPDHALPARAALHARPRPEMAREARPRLTARSAHPFALGPTT